MSDRYTSQDSSDFQTRVIQIDLVFTAGASGAVPALLTYSDGIKSVAVSGNNYVVTFQDGYKAFLNGYGFVEQASVDATKAWVVKPSADAAAGVAPDTVTLSCYHADGTAILLQVGDVLHYTFRMKNA